MEHWNFPVVDDNLLGFMKSDIGYWYVATVYSKYAAGIVASFEEACRVSAWLIRRGLGVFCPIAHTHPIAIYGGFDPLDHSIWLPLDRPLMRAASGLVVASMENWELSYGVGQEIVEFERMDKPIFLLEWPRPEGEA